jgi:hypothetical protein
MVNLMSKVPGEPVHRMATRCVRCTGYPKLDAEHRVDGIQSTCTSQGTCRQPIWSSSFTKLAVAYLRWVLAGGLLEP